MADLQTVIGLLYRADWTRLSLSAAVRSERDGDLALRRLRAMRPSGFRPGPTMRLRPDPGGGPPIMEDVPEEELGGYHYGQAELLIAPGGRYRLEHGEETGRIDGSDGVRGWTWCGLAWLLLRRSRSTSARSPRSPSSCVPPGCSAGFPWTCEAR